MLLSSKSLQQYGNTYYEFGTQSILHNIMQSNVHI